MEKIKGNITSSVGLDLIQGRITIDMQDMRYLNSFLWCRNSKWRSRNTVKMLEPDNYIFTVDLQNGYYHINMNKTALLYMEFEWKGQFYVYKVLPFKLAIFLLEILLRGIVSSILLLLHLLPTAPTTTTTSTQLIELFIVQVDV